MKSLQLTKPYLLVVVGLPGSGKSYFAEKFSDTFSAPYVDFGHFTRIAGNQKTGHQLATHSLGQLLRTKQTIVIEGRGATKADRKDIVLAAHKNGYATLFIWVQTEPATAEHRAVYAKSATMTQAEFDDQAGRFENLVPGEQYVVISGKHTHPSQAKTVLRRLVTDRPEATIPKPTITRQVPPRPTRSGRIRIG